MIVEGQSPGQHENLPAGPPGMLLLHPQRLVDALIGPEKAARVGIEPLSEIIQRIGFHAIYYSSFTLYYLGPAGVPQPPTPAHRQMIKNNWTFAKWTLSRNKIFPS
jgi:hypothetical protein